MNMHEDTGRNISASWGILLVTDRLSAEMPHLLLSHTYTHTHTHTDRQRDRQTDRRTGPWFPGWAYCSGAQLQLNNIVPYSICNIDSAADVYKNTTYMHSGSVFKIIVRFFSHLGIVDLCRASYCNKKAVCLAGAFAAKGWGGVQPPLTLKKFTCSVSQIVARVVFQLSISSVTSTWMKQHTYIVYRYASFRLLCEFVVRL